MSEELKGGRGGYKREKGKGSSEDNRRANGEKKWVGVEKGEGEERAP
jgi:hypothetical protein